METTTEQLVYQRELQIDASPGDGVGVPRRPGEGRALEGPAGRWRSTRAGRRVPDRDHPRQHRERRSSSSWTGRAGIVYTWGWEPGADGPNAVPPGSSTVEIELVPEDGGTKLLFTHRDLPTREVGASRTAQGWDHYLGRLAVAAAGGDPGPDPWLGGVRGIDA